MHMKKKKIAQHSHQTMGNYTRHEYCYVTACILPNYLFTIQFKSLSKLLKSGLMNRTLIVSEPPSHLFFFFCKWIGCEHSQLLI